MKDINKDVLVVTKLIQETQSGNIVWDTIELNIDQPGESILLDKIYTTKYKNKYLRLYRYKTKILATRRDPMVIYLNPQVDRDYWETNVRLEFTDYSYRNSEWAFPQISSIQDLYNTVRYTTADVRVFFDEVLNDLVIYRAIYGSEGSFVDMTSKLSEKITDDKLSILISNDIAGDPIPGTPKTLKIKYSFRGRTSEKEIPEGEELNIP